MTELYVKDEQTKEALRGKIDYLENYILDLQAYIELAWDHIPPHIQDMIKELEGKE